VRTAFKFGLTPIIAGCAVVVGLVPLAAGSAYAQSAPPLPGVAVPAPAKPAPAKAPAAKAAVAPAASAGGGDAALRQRVEQLEEQIVDMQVVIGTLESLARAPAPSAVVPRAAGAASSADAARVQSLESQVQALSAQLQQLSNEVRSGRRSELPVGAPPAAAATAPPLTPAGGAVTGRETVSSFGSTTITSDSAASDPIGGYLASEPPPAKLGEALPALPGAGGGVPDAVAALPPAGVAGGDPQQMYSTAYGYLLGKNYGAAQTGFEEFLRKYARDALAPDALYWLGEAHYMQKNYGDAAEAFDLVTASYGSSSKAPEAQLRRASSLVQLGRTEDACAALRQLTTKYPNARPVLKTKADAERQRAGCT